MKLLIEIEKETYEALIKEKDFLMRAARNPLKIAIVNGTPVDDDAEDKTN